MTSHPPRTPSPPATSSLALEVEWTGAIPAIAMATATNDTASIATTASRPPRPTATPPSGAPTRREIDPPAANAALAATSCSSLTTLGSSANDAGLLICLSTACTPATRNTIHTRSAVAASNGSNATACATLVLTMVSRRSHLSATAPPKGPRTTLMISSMRNTTAVLRPDPVVVNT